MELSTMREMTPEELNAELEKMKQKQIEDSIRALYDMPGEGGGKDPYILIGLDDF